MYEQATHQSIMTAIISPTITRNNFLDAWISQESGGRHWGVNATDHRLVVGAADSCGSFGFHQIQSRYLWGNIRGGNCTALNPENLYEPETSAAGIVLWVARLNCGVAMRSAMFGNHDQDYNNGGVTRVRRSNHQAVALAAGVNYAIDDYERL